MSEPELTAERHPLNAPGPFYTENCCISCGAPVEAAGDLMAWADSLAMTGRLDEHGCVFVRQPTTAAETERAIGAIESSCCGDLRYGGTDPAILRRLLEAGYHSQCDAVDGPAGHEVLRQLFTDRLLEGIAYCALRAAADDPAGSLRSSCLTDVREFRATRLILDRSPELRWSAVRHLWGARAEALAAARVCPTAYSPADGRLLAVDLYGAGRDPVLEQCTEGFLDARGVPPWDGWVWYAAQEAERAQAWDGQTLTPSRFMDLLISWVPACFTPHAEAGITRCSGRYLRWLADLDTTFARLVASWGLAGEASPAGLGQPSGGA